MLVIFHERVLVLCLARRRRAAARDAHFQDADRIQALQYIFIERHLLQWRIEDHCVLAQRVVVRESVIDEFLADLVGHQHVRRKPRILDPLMNSVRKNPTSDRDTTSREPALLNMALDAIKPFLTTQLRKRER